jgi:hypothetical protein
MTSLTKRHYLGGTSVNRVDSGNVLSACLGASAPSPSAFQKTTSEHLGELPTTTSGRSPATAARLRPALALTGSKFGR